MQYCLLLCLFASRRIGSNDGRDNSCGQGFAGWPRRVAGRLLAGLDYPAASLAGLRAARERWRAAGAARGSASTGLVLITLLTALSGVIDGLSADLLVVLLEGSQVLTGLGELTFLHTLTNVPRMRKIIKLSIKTVRMRSNDGLGASGVLRTVWDVTYQ
jgi:hypothetical protein